MAALLPALAVDLDDAAPGTFKNGLDVAWSEGFTPYEAALLVAYLVAGSLLGAAYTYRAQTMLREKIRPVQDDWLKRSLVRLEIIRSWYPKAEEELRKQREGRHWPQKPNSTTRSPNRPPPAPPARQPGPRGLHVMPDVASREPARVFVLGRHTCLLVRDVGPYVDFEFMREVPEIRFPLVLVVASPNDQDDFCFITVEQRRGSKPRIVVFPRVSERRSLGQVDAPVDEDWFVVQAMRIIAARFNLEPHWQEIP